METQVIRQKENINSFEFQEIVTASKNNQKWYEMLFRPPCMDPNFSVDSYFMNMNKNDKISFDIKTLKAICSFQKTNKRQRISINVSPYSLCDVVFINCLNCLIESKDLNPKLICLEIVDVIKVLNNNVSKTTLPDSFISGLANFARTQKIQTVLEGIETDKDLKSGIKLGFDNFQGYLFS